MARRTRWKMLDFLNRVGFPEVGSSAQRLRMSLKEEQEKSEEEGFLGIRVFELVRDSHMGSRNQRPRFGKQMKKKKKKKKVEKFQGVSIFFLQKMNSFAEMNGEEGRRRLKKQA